MRRRITFRGNKHSDVTGLFFLLLSHHASALCLIAPAWAFPQYPSRIWSFGSKLYNNIRITHRSTSGMFSVLTIRSPLYANRMRQWRNSPDGAVKKDFLKWTATDWKLMLATSGMLRLLFSVTVVAGFYQVKSARELVNHVMPWTDELCLETAFSWYGHGRTIRWLWKAVWTQ